MFNDRIRLKDKHYLVIFLAPAIIALAGLSLYPLIFSLKTSFFGWDLIKPGSDQNFVGFRNYVTVLTNRAFLDAVWVTLKYTFLSVIMALLAGTAMSFLFYQNLWGTWVVRTIVITAMVISPVIVGTLWRLMYSPDFGIINYALSLIGIGPYSFLAEKSTVLGALILVDVWEFAPLVMVIVLATLQGISPTFYEAGVIDGANSMQLFIHITLPMLRPALLLALLIRTMDCFRTFDSIYAMTGGGPGTSSQNLNILMYNTGFEFFQISKVCAMAIISLFIITTICLILVKNLKEESIW